MKKYFVTATAALILVPLLQACWKDSNNPTKDLTPSLPSETYRYSEVSLPDHLGGSMMKDLGVTDEGANLGRVLFYDAKLSLNNRIACGSCHLQSHAFSDFTASSEGFEGKRTPRNSMPIINPVLNPTLFWDARSSSVEDLTLRPIQNHIEMGMESLDMLEEKLAKTSYYPELFEKAFGSKEVTSERIRNAMSQFLRTMVSGESKYDEAIANNSLDKFNTLEKLGYQLFISSRAKCSSCHTEPSFSATSASKSNVAGFGVNVFNDNPTVILNDPIEQPEPNPYMGSITNPSAPKSGAGAKGTTNIGLDMVYADQGIGDGSFRIPSLRNIELTAPYMHDGRFATLEDVVNHYDHGIKAHPHLDDKFKNNDGTPIRMNLTDIEKQALVAFLKTLTDKKLTTDAKYANPFK